MQKAKKPDGEKYAPSTIERYVGFLHNDIEKIHMCKSKKEIILVCNELIRKKSNMIHYSAIKAYLWYLQTVNNYESDLIDHIKPPKTRYTNALKSRKMLQNKILSRDELRDLFEKIKDLETKALFCVLYDTACRRSEVIGIKFKDIRWTKSEEKKLIKSGIYAKIRVVGKGNKVREVYLNKTSRKLIYKIYEGKIQTKNVSLFQFNRGDGKARVDKGHRLYEIVKTTTKRILQRDVSPHCMRHTKATHMADAGADILSISAYLGHESVKTSEIYIEVSPYRGMKAYSKFGDYDIGKM